MYTYIYILYILYICIYIHRDTHIWLKDQHLRCAQSFSFPNPSIAQGPATLLAWLPPQKIPGFESKTTYVEGTALGNPGIPCKQ